LALPWVRNGWFVPRPVSSTNAAPLLETYLVRHTGLKSIPGEVLARDLYINRKQISQSIGPMVEPLPGPYRKYSVALP